MIAWNYVVTCLAATAAVAPFMVLGVVAAILLIAGVVALGVGIVILVHDFIVSAKNQWRQQ